MKKLIIPFLLILLLTYGCSDQPKQESSDDNQLPIEGVWKRLGTLRVVNGIPVDKDIRVKISRTFLPVISLSGSAAFIRVLTVPTVAASNVDIDGLVVMRSSYGKSLNELNGTIAIFPLLLSNAGDCIKHLTSFCSLLDASITFCSFRN